MCLKIIKLFQFHFRLKKCLPSLHHLKYPQATHNILHHLLQKGSKKNATTFSPLLYRHRIFPTEDTPQQHSTTLSEPIFSPFLGECLYTPSTKRRPSHPGTRTTSSKTPKRHTSSNRGPTRALRTSLLDKLPHCRPDFCHPFIQHFREFPCQHDSMGSRLSSSTHTKGSVLEHNKGVVFVK